MANRIVGNVYILDSATTIAVSIDWPEYKAKIQSVVFLGTATNSALELVYADDTASTAIRFGPPDIVGQADQQVFDGTEFSALRIKTLTAGTAFIYFT